MNIKPRFCLEDGWDLDKTIEFEQIRKQLEIQPEQVLYGYGGYIVNSPFTQLTRDRVSAVWKLTQTGNAPTMKFGDAENKGKESIPGLPVLYWSKYGTFILQRGENIPLNLRSYNCAFSIGGEPMPNPSKLQLKYGIYYSGLYSPGTKALIRSLSKKRNEIIEEIKK